MFRAGALLLLAAAALSVSAADLSAVRADTDLNRRADRALDNADQALEEAREAFHANDSAKLEAALREIRDSGRLCLESLSLSKQDPHRNKHYKRAELHLRSLIRMMAGFSDQLPLDQRDGAVAIQHDLQDIHDKILEAELERKK